MAIAVAAILRAWGCACAIDATGKGGSGGQLTPEQDSHVDVYAAAIGRSAIDHGLLIPHYWSANRDNGAKFDLISHLALMTEQRRILVPRVFADLIRQMQNYTILQACGSGSRFGPRVPSIHDDLVASLALACWGFRERWYKARRTESATLSAAWT
jgi:hypothetical protein